jgi:acyl-CoA thioesterase-1
MSLGCTAALSACGGGGSAGAPAPASAPPVPPKQVTIDAEGDSTMVLCSPYLQSMLSAQFGDSVIVQHNAVSGSTVTERMSGASPFNAAYVPTGAQIVIANWAINDSVIETTGQYQYALVQFISTARASGATVVLEEPNPVSVTDHPIGPYVAVMDDIAYKVTAPLVQQYQYIQTLPNWQSLLGDGIHPSPALCQIKAQREAAILAPIIARLQ